MNTVLLPERKPYHDYLGLFEKGEAIGHNNCLREVARLNASPNTVQLPRELADRLTSSDNHVRQTARRELRNMLLAGEQ